ncbi:hypothetical protein BJP36_16475 [Moorena producens JHB]|uniref:DUF1574 domain-containing protein n=1 Tax=Moorena producens (strain JHB) TaxID=1454205 RepID=A0A1D9G124_MOOP1|nr:hypothetical protein [Moorena producens]AOY81261.1 hypothetical protein BJP36_16475 [Moorena producens JHB]
MNLITKFDIWKNWSYSKLLPTTAYSSIFAITLTAVFVIANIIAPYPNIPDNLGLISLKLEYFAKHKDEYNAIFIGPSTTYRGIVPNVFDQLMAEQNREIKSFNFGINGAIAAETDFYLRKIISLKPAKLEWLFVEYPERTLEQHINKNANSARGIYWHTPRQTLLDFRLIMELKQNLIDKFFAGYATLQSCLIRTFWMGRFANFWQVKVLGMKLFLDEMPDYSILAQESGYYAHDWQKLQRHKYWHQFFLDNLKDDYYQDVEQLRQGNISPIKPYSLKVLKEMCQYIENHGIKPILFISPIVQERASTAINLYKQSDVLPLFAFNDPEVFPNLYQLDRRFDFLHLNHQGATELTGSLAKQFAQYLETEKASTIAKGTGNREQGLGSIE